MPKRRLLVRVILILIIASMLIFTFGCDVKSNKDKASVSVTKNPPKGFAEFRKNLAKNKKNKGASEDSQQSYGE